MLIIWSIKHPHICTYFTAVCIFKLDLGDSTASLGSDSRCVCACQAGIGSEALHKGIEDENLPF